MRLSEYSDIMTSEEVADYLKVSLPTVYKLIDSKELYARKVGKIIGYQKISCKIICFLI